MRPGQSNQLTISATYAVDIAPYVAVSVLYSRINGVKIDPIFALVGDEQTQSFCGELIKHATTDKKRYAAIVSIREKYRLNENFCDRLATNDALRNVLIYAIHDWKWMSFSEETDNVSFVLDMSSSGFGGFLDGRYVRLSFPGAKYVRNKDFDRTKEYFCDRQYFIPDERQLAVKLCFWSHEKTPDLVTFDIFADDLALVPLGNTPENTFNMAVKKADAPKDYDKIFAPYKAVALLYTRINGQSLPPSFLQSSAYENITRLCENITEKSKTNEECYQCIATIKEKYDLSEYFCAFLANNDMLRKIVLYDIKGWKMVSCVTENKEVAFVLEPASGTSVPFLNSRYALLRFTDPVCVEVNDFSASETYYCDGMKFNADIEKFLAMTLDFYSHDHNVRTVSFHITATDLLLEPTAIGG